MPPREPPREWEEPRAPWSRLHVDLAGPCQGQSFLIVVDSFSKWVEVVLMHSTTADAVIRALRRIFSTHGLPDILVSDNGPQFTATPFETFLATQGIRHCLIAPFHPASNGCAERAVRSAKEALQRLGHGSWQERVDNYLFAQHTTPCQLTNKTPAELLMGRRLRTALDRIHPQHYPSKPIDSVSRRPPFRLQDPVYARNYGGQPLWLPGIIAGIAGPRSYRVDMGQGREWRRHQDQLRSRCWNPGQALDDPRERYTGRAEQSAPIPTGDSSIETYLPEDGESGVGPEAVGDDLGSSSTTIEPAAAPCPTDESETPTGPRRSGRIRHRPAYLQDYACASLVGRGVTY